jgi:hypothetical protein
VLNDHVLNDHVLNDRVLHDHVLRDHVLNDHVLNDRVLHDHVLRDHVLNDQSLSPLLSEPAACQRSIDAVGDRSAVAGDCARFNCAAVQGIAVDAYPRAKNGPFFF